MVNDFDVSRILIDKALKRIPEFTLYLLFCFHSSTPSQSPNSQRMPCAAATVTASAFTFAGTEALMVAVSLLMSILVNGVRQDRCATTDPFGL